MNPLFNRHLRAAPRSNWLPNSALERIITGADGALDTLPKVVRLPSERTREWHPAAFALGCSLSLILLLSWFLEPTRSMWLTIDDKVFWTLNSSLADKRAWQVFWAAANNRAVDIITGLSLVGLFAHFVLHSDRDRIDSIISVFLTIVGLGIAGSQIGKAMAVSRWSGTMLHPEALRLSELVTWIPTKDISGDSFPGDHATVLLIVAGIVTYYLPRSYAAVAWLVALVFMTPRVVGGAHWLTDDLVGSVSIAGFVLTCVLATPLHQIMTDSLEHLIGRIRMLRRSPV